MAKKKKDKELLCPVGKMPGDDKANFIKLVDGLCDSWDIKKPQDVMLVNRMVSAWMKMRRVEDMLGNYDLFFERRDNKGNMIGVNMNQLAYYLSKLEADFRAYYRLLQSKNANISQTQDFHDFINVGKK